MDNDIEINVADVMAKRRHYRLLDQKKHKRHTKQLKAIRKLVKGADFDIHDADYLIEIVGKIQQVLDRKWK